MQYIPCNNALLAQETLLLSQRSTLCEGASCLRKTSAPLNDIHTKTDSRKIPTLTPKTRRQAPIITQIENQTKTGFRKILPITLERKNKYTHYYPSFLSHHWWHFLFSDFILDFKRYKGSSWLTSHSILFQIPNFEGALSAEPFGVQIKLKLS